MTVYYRITHVLLLPYEMLPIDVEAVQTRTEKDKLLHYKRVLLPSLPDQAN